MTDAEYTSTILEIEAWANREIAKYTYVPPADPKPGAGEPGHAYGTAAALAYEAKFAKERAEIIEAMEFLTSCVECLFYGEPLPEPPNKLAAHEMKRFAIFCEEA